MSIPYPPLQSKSANFKTDPPVPRLYQPIPQNNLPPELHPSPPNAYKPPSSHSLPSSTSTATVYKKSTHTDINWESDHGSPVVSPYANSVASSSSSSNLSGFESVSLKSLSSEELARENDAVETIQPPAPAFLRENNNSGVYTQGRMLWRLAHIPYSRITGLPFAIIEEEEPQGEDSDESRYPGESWSLSSGEEQQGTKTESRATVVSDGSEKSDVVDRKKRRRDSLRKRIKRMFVEKRNAVKLGLKVEVAN